MFLVFFTFDKIDTLKLINQNNEIIKPKKQKQNHRYTYANYYKFYYLNNEQQLENRREHHKKY